MLELKIQCDDTASRFCWTMATCGWSGPKCPMNILKARSSKSFDNLPRIHGHWQGCWKLLRHWPSFWMVSAEVLLFYLQSSLQQVLFCGMVPAADHPEVAQTLNNLGNALPRLLRVCATSGWSVPKRWPWIFKTRSSNSFWVWWSPKAPWAWARFLRATAASWCWGPSLCCSRPKSLAFAAWPARMYALIKCLALLASSAGRPKRCAWPNCLPPRHISWASTLDLVDGLHHGDLVILPHVVGKFGQICCRALSRSECIIAQLNVLHQVHPRADLWAILAIHKDMNQFWLPHISRTPICRALTSGRQYTKRTKHKQPIWTVGICRDQLDIALPTELRAWNRPPSIVGSGCHGYHGILILQLTEAYFKLGAHMVRLLCPLQVFQEPLGVPPVDVLWRHRHANPPWWNCCFLNHHNPKLSHDATVT